MLYLKNDVFLLTDVFQNCINTYKSTYDKIPLCSYSTQASHGKRV